MPIEKERRLSGAGVSGMNVAADIGTQTLQLMETMMVGADQVCEKLTIILKNYDEKEQILLNELESLRVARQQDTATFKRMKRARASMRGDDNEMSEEDQERKLVADNKIREAHDMREMLRAEGRAYGESYGI